MKIVIVGSSGLLGHALVDSATRSNLKYQTVDRDQLNNPDKFPDIIENFRPDFVICTVALPSNRLCEESPASALTSNLLIPLEIARAAKARSTKSIFFSSHGVFKPRQQKRVTTIEEAPDSDTFYGLMKQELEKSLCDLSSNLFSIIRLPSLYGTRPRPGNKGVCERILDDLIQNKDVTVREDLFDSYSNVDDIAKFLVANIEKISTERVSHLSNSGIMSLGDFARIAAEHIESKSQIKFINKSSQQIFCNALETSIKCHDSEMPHVEKALERHCKKITDLDLIKK